MGWVIRFVDLEYTTSFDREGTSTDHEVEGVLPRDRNIERLNNEETPPSLRHEFWACLSMKQMLVAGRAEGGSPNCNRKKNYRNSTKANPIAECEREGVL